MRSRADEPGIPDDEILPKYDLTESVPNPYLARYAPAGKLVRLDPEVARVFPDSEAVNRALRALAQIIEERTKASAAKVPSSRA